MSPRAWEKYETAAQYLLDQFAKHLDLSSVEPKQLVPGLVSGTQWEIDAKGVYEDSTGFVVVEIRRHTTSRFSQESAAALAYRIIDTGASGGIMVSPLGPQEGATKIAAAANIVHVTLTSESTTKDYLMKFLQHVFLGASDEIRLTLNERVTIRKFDEHGKLLEEAHIPSDPSCENES